MAGLSPRVTSISRQLPPFGKVKVLVTDEGVGFGGEEARPNNGFTQMWAAKDLTV
jgi:hypothetical protein